MREVDRAFLAGLLMIGLRLVGWSVAIVLGLVVVKPLGLVLLVAALSYPFLLWMRDFGGTEHKHLTAHVLWGAVAVYVALAAWMFHLEAEYFWLLPLIMFGCGLGYFLHLGTEAHAHAVLRNAFPRLAYAIALISLILFAALNVAATYVVDLPPAYAWGTIALNALTTAATSLSGRYFMGKKVDAVFGGNNEGAGWFGLMLVFVPVIFLITYAATREDLALYIGAGGYVFGLWFVYMQLAMYAERLAEPVKAEAAD